MIEINLLPEEMRKKKKKAVAFTEADISSVDLSRINIQSIKTLSKNVPAVKWAIIAIAGLVVFHILLLAIGTYGRIHLHILTKEYDVISSKKREADILRAQSESITRKVNAINELMVKRFSWAKKLNFLSDSITPGVWLYELSYETRIVERPAHPGRSAPLKGKKQPATEKVPVSYLILSGYTSQMGESGAALVGKFIKALKSNPAFYDDFTDITLVSIKSDKVDSQEVMNFRITCPFREGKE